MIEQVIEFTDHMPPTVRKPAVVCADLPAPMSVNRTRRIDWKAKRAIDAWTRQADALVLSNGGARRLGKITGRFEVTICFDESVTGIDLDNGPKQAIDFCRRLELIENDSPKYMRRVVLEWGTAPTGCRVTLREVA